jgi:hypothetical protein
MTIMVHLVLYYTVQTPELVSQRLSTAPNAVWCMVYEGMVYGV